MCFKLFIATHIKREKNKQAQLQEAVFFQSQEPVQFELKVNGTFTGWPVVPSHC